MDELTLRPLLFDFYGSLLTPKQKEIYDLYYQQDLSLGEIAEQKNVSRQAIFDLLKRTEDALNLYEEKLGLVARYQKNQELISLIRLEISRIKQEFPQINEKLINEYLQKLEDNW
ncbi:MAG: YlxM family DNA-binding protein [Peptococcia bacterium]